MDTKRIDGKKIAAEMKAETALQVRDLREAGTTPGLTVVLVGENPASRLYVRNKVKTCRELGIASELVELPRDASTEELLRVIGRLNRDDETDGVLVQLPLPGQIDAEKVLQAVHPAKDVDGFNPVNVGKLCLGRQTLAPCTPMGILEMLSREGVGLEGAHAVIVGRSNIVGKPLAHLLLHRHCTVTLCHSRTRDLPGICRQADLLVAAVGRPALVTAEFIKPGAVVVDVGINRIQDRDQAVRLWGEGHPRIATFDKRGAVLVGDVHPLAPLGLASAVTPVPGGVGPLTIAQLMKNTVLACQARRARFPRQPIG